MTMTNRKSRINKLAARTVAILLRACLLAAMIGRLCPANASTAFTFTLSRPAHTSAGVYDSSGKLVRTLWRDVFYNTAGMYTASWDDHGDDGSTFSSGSYTVKVLAHDMNYVWEGAVGNTSDYTSGSNQHRGFHFMTTLCFGGATGFYSTGYCEISRPFHSFSASTPQQVASTFSGCTTGSNVYGWHYSDSDGTRVYFACPAVENQTNPVQGVLTAPGAVCGFNVSNSTVANFTNGYVIKEKYHPFTNGILVGTQPSITGLAVQRSHNLLAVSVAADNAVYLIDKTSGSVLSSLSVTGAGLLAIDANDNLWVQSGTSVGLYTNLNTTPTLTTVISGLAQPTALAVSPASASQPNQLIIADGGSSQQLKAYNSAGALQWTYGAAGGFASDPAVTTSKFWFHESNEGDLSSIAFQPDGTFWVLDGMNDRVLHFQLGASSGVSPSYIEQIAFMQYVYIINVDQNNPNRVFGTADGKWFEFNVDYTKTLAGTNGSWTLVKNWSHNMPAGFSGGFEGFAGLATLSNGRTYGLAIDNATNKRQVVELPATGNLRYTGIETTATFLYADGSLRFQSVSAGTNTFTKQALTGFDGSGNPTWGAPTVLATSPGAAGIDPTSGIQSLGPRLPITSSNVLTFFDNSLNSGMHLGGVNLSGATNAWAWESSPSVLSDNPWDGIGSYDIGDGVDYGGALHDVSGRSIVYGYKGEGWTNAEANQLTHWYDDGLFIGQFGTPTWGGDVSYAGAAANMQLLNMVTTGGKTYVYTGDETQHSGITRWRLDGLGTIAELTGTGAIDTAIPLTGTAPIGSNPSTTSTPPTPVTVMATPGRGKVWLTWTPSSGAVYYKIKRSTLSGDAFQTIATCVFPNDFSDLNVTNGSTYYYVVSAVGGTGERAASLETVATPSAAANVYEAEDGTVTAPSSIQNDGYSSGGKNVSMSSGSNTISGINGGAGGTFTLDIRYAGLAVTPHLTVNGSAVTLTAFTATGGWSGPGVYADHTVSIVLAPGTGNTITLSNAGGINIDKYTISVDTPFYGAPLAIPTSGTVSLESENYDYGGEGVSYHDTSSPFTYGVYRPADGVNISNATTASNGFNIGNCNNGEWLKYSVSAPVTGTYTFVLYAATSITGTSVHLEDELGNNLTGTMTITNTGSFTTFAANTKSIALTAGTHTLKLVEDVGGFNLDRMTFTH